MGGRRGVACVDKDLIAREAFRDREKHQDSEEGEVQARYGGDGGEQ
jgi:hypothetical protein